MSRPCSARLLACAACLAPLLAGASSHREAPFIIGAPKVDGTDLYMFRSYESGRADYVTLIANYIPFQDPPGGPNFYPLDPKARYEINVDNDGDAQPDLRFQFKFNTEYAGTKINAGGKQVQVPVINIGPVGNDQANLAVTQSYTLGICYGKGGPQLASNAATGATSFKAPADNIGRKSIADYAAYSANFKYEVNIPGCSTPGRVFVGQRKESFFINVGEIFDLVNTNPVGPRNAEPNDLSGKNVTSLALEIPISCLTREGEPVVGAWTTASLRQARVLNNKARDPNRTTIEGGAWTQVSRLGMPLVNEVVIGVTDKDRFNGARPDGDAQFLDYVTNPTLPIILNTLFGDAAKVPGMPRNDLVAVFLTGVEGLNQPAAVTPSEMMRLNTSIPPTAAASQNDLGVLGGDNAGFPNGRRPVDDVVDIALRVVEGALCGSVGNCGSQTADPNGGAPYTDGARAAGATGASASVSGAIRAGDVYLDVFPYLNVPLPGSPNGIAD